MTWTHPRSRRPARRALFAAIGAGCADVQARAAERATIHDQTPVPTPPEDGNTTTGAGTPDPAPVVTTPARVRVTCTAGVPRLAGMAWRDPAWPHLMGLPRGHSDAAPACDPLAGPARHAVGTPPPPEGVPTAPTTRQAVS